MFEDWPDWEENPPPRVADLAALLASEIPCSPDTKEVREELAAKTIGDLIFIYFSWRQRFIPAQPRRVEFGRGFWTPRAHALNREVRLAVRAITDGKDLGPFLSDKIKTMGFVPRKGRKAGPNWADKDFALNTQGVHHVHLARLAGSRTRQSDDLLFLSVKRHSARLLMVGDHKSFDSETLAEATQHDGLDTGERELRGVAGLSHECSASEQRRLARVGVNTITAVGGQYVIGEPVSLSGDRVIVRREADMAIEVIRWVEERLHQPEYAKRLFAGAGGKGQPEGQWRWSFWDRELVLEECANPADVKSLMVFAARL